MPGGDGQQKHHSKITRVTSDYTFSQGLTEQPQKIVFAFWFPPGQHCYDFDKHVFVRILFQLSHSKKWSVSEDRMAPHAKTFHKI